MSAVLGASVAKKWSRKFCFAMIAAALAGCGPSGIPKHAKVYEVHGEVTIDDQPATKAVRLEFYPTSYDNGMDAHGAVQSDDGDYWATTYRDEKGLQPGEYKVVAWGKGVPVKYTKLETTDLTATVKAEDNTINFSLTSGGDDDVAADGAADAEE